MAAPLICRALAVILSALPSGAFAGAETARYRGQAGQQQVSFFFDLEENALRGGHYTYTSQKSDIRIVDARVFGSTVVLQDEDGNILHLHFETASGQSTGSWKSAERLEGTLERGDLDLRVELTRAAD